MNSAIIKVLAVVLAWPVVAIVILQSYEWYREATYVRTVEPLSRERIQHPTYFQFAEDALRNYGKLSKEDRQFLKDELRRIIVPTAVWLKRLNASDARMICLGESHDDHNRRFMAESIFSGLDMDALFVETTPQGLAEIRGYMQAGEIYAPLLGADMGPVLQAAQARNPNLRIDGIEETGQQRADRLEQRRGSREASIFENLKQRYDGGERAVILYGSLHCSYKAGWLYQDIRQNFGGSNPLNILVHGAHQDGLIETFVYFLDELGIAPGDFVITDTQGLPSWVRENFTWLWAQLLSQYQSVVVYRP